MNDKWKLVAVCAASVVAGAILPAVAGVPLKDRVGLATGNLLSGVMALAGFLATARSVLIFKLHEDVYSKPEYQDRVRSRSGSAVDIYGPLTCFDSKIGVCLCFCASSVVLLLVASMAREMACCGLAFSDLALGAVMATAVLFVRAVASMNRNFNAIIREWGKHVPKPSAQ